MIDLIGKTSSVYQPKIIFFTAFESMFVPHRNARVFDRGLKGFSIRGQTMDLQTAAPEDLKMESLYPEAWLLAQMGDAKAALEWITPTLDAQARSSIENLRSVVAAGALVHGMVLRAELANRLGRATEAATWARAVTALWSDADDELRPIAKEMKRLAK